MPLNTDAFGAVFAMPAVGSPAVCGHLPDIEYRAPEGGGGEHFQSATLVVRCERSTQPVSRDPVHGCPLTPWDGHLVSPRFGFSHSPRLVSRGRSRDTRQPFTGAVCGAAHGRTRIGRIGRAPALGPPGHRGRSMHVTHPVMVTVLQKRPHRPTGLGRRSLIPPSDIPVDVAEYR